MGLGYDKKVCANKGIKAHNACQVGDQIGMQQLRNLDSGLPNFSLPITRLRGGFGVLSKGSESNPKLE